MSAHVGLTAELKRVRGGGEKIVIRDAEGMVMELVVLAPESGLGGATIRTFASSSSHPSRDRR